MSEITKNQQAVMDYDPNLLYSGRMAKQVVKLTFGEWKYRAEMTVTVGGNTRGLSVIEYAVERAFEELTGEDEFATLMMAGSEGDTLMDDEGYDEEWLKGKLIKAEIISITPDK